MSGERQAALVLLAPARSKDKDHLDDHAEVKVDIMITRKVESVTIDNETDPHGSWRDRQDGSRSVVLNPPYSVRESGYAGQEILDADGVVACWTCDEVLAHLLVRLLNRVG
jgi:hypothetical protein